MSDAVIHGLDHRALIRVDGAGSLDFLQDMITPSVDDLPERTVRHGALLTPQGRVLFDLVIAREGGAFLLECDREQRDALMRKLTLHRMRRPITIEADDRRVMAVEGGIEDGHRDTRFGTSVMRFYRADPPAAGADPDAWKRLRWHNGIAEGAVEIPPEKALPLEMRLDLDGGISFEKGCYIGQEVTARTQYRGLVKRSYAPVRIAGPVETPAPILADGREAGTLFSAINDDGGMMGLASVRLEFLDGGTPGLTAGDRAVSPFLPERLKPLPGKG